MRFPSKEQVARQRRLYPAGTRVELVQMDDAQAPPVGTRGTVIGVDDTGSIMVAWTMAQDSTSFTALTAAKRFQSTTKIHRFSYRYLCTIWLELTCYYVPLE